MWNIIAQSFLFSLATAETLTGTSKVYLDQQVGSTNYLASGILLGLPLDNNQIPDEFLTTFGFNNIRSGGSQLPAPSRGWSRGEFQGRYDSLKADYETARRHNAGFQIMIHDMWGTDTYASFAETPMPGDNGSYEDFDNFMLTFFSKLEADGIDPGSLYWDLWNEVDNVDFLNRGIDRWLEYWGHAYHLIKSHYATAIVTGPSYGHLPNFAGDVSHYFSQWASFVAQNGSFPDSFSLHFLYPNGDLKTSIDAWQAYLADAGLHYNGVWNVQEYGSPDQLYPSGAAWNIAQLERNNAFGLRANWEGDLALHDYAANLLSKPASGPNYQQTATGYYPAREFPVYEYYRQKMQGTRVTSTMTDNTLSDSFVVICPADRKVRVLAGSRPNTAGQANTGTWTVKLNKLSALGLPAEGSVNVSFLRFNSAPTLYDRVDPPTDEGTQTWTYSNDEIVWTVFQNDPAVTYAFELAY